MIRQKFAVVALASVLAGLIPDQALATSCLPGSIFQLTARAALVVTGRVIAVDTTPGRQVWFPGGGGLQSVPEAGPPYTLAVERVFKGRAGPSVTAYGSSIMGSPHLVQGERYLLTLNPGRDGRLMLGPCMPGGRLGSDEPLPAKLAWALGRGTPPDPIAPPPGREHTPRTDPVPVLVDGHVVASDPPQITAEGPLIQVRPVAEAAGATVEWLPGVQTVAVRTGDGEAFQRLDEDIAWVNGEQMQLRQKARMEVGRTLVGLPFLAQALGKLVIWDPESWTVQVLDPSTACNEARPPTAGFADYCDMLPRASGNSRPPPPFSPPPPPLGTPWPSPMAKPAPALTEQPPLQVPPPVLAPATPSAGDFPPPPPPPPGDVPTSPPRTSGFGPPPPPGAMPPLPFGAMPPPPPFFGSLAPPSRTYGPWLAAGQARALPFPLAVWDSSRKLLPPPPVRPAASPPTPEPLPATLAFPAWRDDLGTLFGPFRDVHNVEVSPDGQAVWLDATDPELGRLWAILQLAGSGVTQRGNRSLVAWITDGRALVRELAAATPSFVRLLLVAPDGEETSVYTGPDPGRFQGLIDDGAHAVFLGSSGISRLDAGPGMLVPVAPSFPGGAPLDPEPWRRRNLSLTPDGHTAVLAQDGRLYFLSMLTGTWQPLDIPGRWASGPAFSPTGDRVAFVSAPLLPGGVPDIPTNYVGSKDPAGDTLHVITRTGAPVVTRVLARPGRHILSPVWTGDRLIRIPELQYYGYGTEGRYSAVATGTHGLTLTGAEPRAVILKEYGSVDDLLPVPGSDELLWPGWGESGPVLYRMSTSDQALVPIEAWDYRPAAVRPTGGQPAPGPAGPPLVTLNGRLSQLFSVLDGRLTPLSEWMRPGGGRPAALAGGTVAYKVPGAEGAFLRVRAASPLPVEAPPVREAVLGVLPVATLPPAAVSPVTAAATTTTDQPDGSPVMGTPPTASTGGALTSVRPDWQAGNWVLTGSGPVQLVFRPTDPVRRVEFWGATTGRTPGATATARLGEGQRSGEDWAFTYLAPKGSAMKVWANGQTAAGDWRQSQALYVRQMENAARNFRIVASAERAAATGTPPRPENPATGPGLGDWIGGLRLEIIDHPSELGRILPYAQAIGGELAALALSGPFINWADEVLVLAFQSGSSAPIALREFRPDQQAIYADLMPSPGPGTAFVAAVRPRLVELPELRYSGSSAARTLKAGPDPEVSTEWAHAVVLPRRSGPSPFRPPDRLAFDTVEQYLQALSSGDTAAAGALFSRRTRQEGRFPEWLTPIAGFGAIRKWEGPTASGRITVRVRVGLPEGLSQHLPWRSGTTDLRFVLANEPAGMRIEEMEFIP